MARLHVILTDLLIHLFTSESEQGTWETFMFSGVCPYSESKHSPISNVIQAEVVELVFDFIW
jgi:hypothetical protein